MDMCCVRPIPASSGPLLNPVVSEHVCEHMRPNCDRPVQAKPGKEAITLPGAAGDIVLDGE